MKRFSPLVKFSFFSFLVVSLIGVSLGGIISSLITQDVIEHSAIATERIVRSLIDHHLTKEDFRKPLTDSRYHHLNRFIKENVLSQEIARIKIWNKEGKVIYSDERKLAGKKFPLEEDLKKALQGQTTTSISHLEERENIFERSKYQSLIEVYVPIYLNNASKPAGVYEVYQSPNRLNYHIREARKFTLLPLAGGLILLYFTLFGVFKGASRTIVKQNVELRNLTKRLEKSLDKLQENYLGTITALSAAVDAKDHYTAGHSSRVTEYALTIGKELGLSSDQLKNLEKAALFHDIGKIGVPESLLNKPGKLAPEEYRKFQSHPAIGANIIRSINFLKETEPIVRHHHEHYDGTGYPDGLAGEEIPLGARILAVADAYDAMTSDRPYRKALSSEEALRRLVEDINGQFDAEVVEALSKAFHRSGKEKIVSVKS